MKTLIIVVVALVLGTLLAVFSIDDPGMVVLARAPHRIELPLALFAVILTASFALLYLLFNFLFDFFATPKKIKKWTAQRRNKQAQSATLRGYAQLIEGDWQRGEKQLTKRISDSKTPLLNFLGAAYAAQQQKDYKKRDHYLEQAEQIDPSHRMAVDLTRARLLAQAGQTNEAKELLETMHPLAPANKTILRLMADVYQQSGDTVALSALLPKLLKTKALPAEQCAEMDVMCRIEAEGSTTGSVNGLVATDSKPLIKEWKALPAVKKTTPALAALYARKLIAVGDVGAAEVVVRTALKKKWNSELVALYGLCRNKDSRKQISWATTWLSEHDDDANVHMTLARLNMVAGDTEKAQHYYQQAIKKGAAEEAYYELGEHFEAEGDRKAAMMLYKKGVQASISMAGSTAQLDGGVGIAPMELDSVITLGASESQWVPAVVEGTKGVSTGNVAKARVVDLALVESK